MERRAIRQYLALHATDELAPLYLAGDADGIRRLVIKRLHLEGIVGTTGAALRVVGLPSRRWRLELVRGEAPVPRPTGLIVAIELDDAALVVPMREAVHGFGLDFAIGIGADPSFQSTDHWCPGEAADPMHGSRAGAERLIRSAALASADLLGRGVNVVIVDQGLDGSKVPNFAGGWTDGTRRPGRSPDGHGTMIARNVATLAPEAAFFDCPLIPPAIGDIPAFLSDAEAAFRAMLTDIDYLRRSGLFPGPWLLVNAWAVYDRRSEFPPGDYTENPAHLFNRLIADAAAQEIDLVFAAGNCGQFCPDARCGAADRGPGHSIFGANSHADVLTVGAVRTDALWLGYSSQGPGQPGLAAEKPDLCAPSQFSETGDARRLNTGSSAACGIAAGVVAALRERWGPGLLPPPKMAALLRATAHPAGAGWDGRLGHGILDARAAVDAVRRLPP